MRAQREGQGISIRLCLKLGYLVFLGLGFASFDPESRAQLRVFKHFRLPLAKLFGSYHIITRVFHTRAADVGSPHTFRCPSCQQ